MNMVKMWFKADEKLKSGEIKEELMKEASELMEMKICLV